MAKSIVGGAGAPTGCDNSVLTTFFSAVGGTLENVNAIEEVEYKYGGLGAGEAAVFSKMRVYVSDNQMSADGIFSFMVNGVESFSLTITAGVSGWFSTDTESATIANDDLIAIKLVRTDNGSFAFQPIHVQLSVTGSEFATWIVGGTPSFYAETDTLVNETRISGYFDMTSDVTPTAQDEFRFRHTAIAGGTGSNFQCYVSENTATDVTIVKMMKNGVDTGQTLTIAAGYTGIVVAGGHIIIASGDQISCRVDSSASSPGNYCFIRSLHFMVISSDTTFDVVAAGGRTMGIFSGGGGTNYGDPNIPIGLLGERPGA